MRALFKKTFPAVVPGHVKYVPMGNKNLKRCFPWIFRLKKKTSLSCLKDVCEKKKRAEQARKIKITIVKFKKNTHAGTTQSLARITTGSGLKVVEKWYCDTFSFCEFIWIFRIIQ